MRADEVALLGALTHRLPFLRSVLQAHLDDWDGLLPHLLLADITRWMVAEHLADERSPRLRQVLAELERLYAEGTGHEQELLCVSFLENLPYPGEPGDGIVDLLGPGLRAALEAGDGPPR